MISDHGILAYVACSGPQGVGTIHLYRLNLATGALEFVHQSEELRNPTFLVVHPNKRSLYCVSEMSDYQGQSAGAVSAFAIDPQTHKLALLSQQSTLGGSPCFVGLDATGRWAQVSNFGGGNLAMFPILADGSLGPASDTAQHPTLGDKQPRAHSVRMDPTNRIAVACDLGLDRVMFFRVDLEHGKFTPNGQPYLQLAPGAGPRHSEFHPNGKWLYVINELNNTMSTIAYDAAQGTFTEIEALSTLPAGYAERSYCGDVHVTPDGRFVYGTNRGQNAVVGFSIDQATGKLTPVCWEPCQGDWPRNMAIDPTGRYLFSATHNSNNIVSFAIDTKTGKLTPTGNNLQLPVPMCVKFVTV